MAGGVASADSLFAATDRNDDPARPHLVAITARRDMQHWLLWAQHHGLKPNIIVPAALLLPAPATGFSRGQIGGVSVLRGVDLALTQDMAVPALLGDAPVRDVVPDEVNALSIAALNDPRSEEHTSELQSLMRISYAVFCLK